MTARPSPAPSLPPTAYALLGLLSFGRELTGYDLKKWADNSLRFFYWSPAISQIYGELKRLDRLGYVAARDISGDERRARRVYRITDTGRDALVAWLEADEVELPVLKHQPLLKLWLGHLSSPSELQRLLDAHRRNVEALLDDARSAAAGARRQHDMAFPQLVTEWSVRYLEHELAMVDDLGRAIATTVTAPGDGGPDRAGPAVR